MDVKKKQKIAAFVFIALALVFLVGLPVSAGNFATWSSMSSGSKKDLNNVWGASSSDVFAVGKAGTILYYDGSAWSSLRSGTAVELTCVWGSDNNDVFAAGKSGIILHYDGTSWSSMTSGSASDLYSLWGVDGTDVFAAGNSGTILHYDGTSWSSMSSGVTSGLNAIWGVDNTDIFAAGNSGTILHYNGTTWSALNSGLTVNLNAIWGVDGTDVFAAGISGAILHYDGSAWSIMSSGTTGDLYGIWGAGRSDIFVVGESGLIARYDGSAWSSMNRNTLTELHSVYGFSPEDVFAAGWSGAILHYNPPVIDSISPEKGDQGATLNVIIAGTNLKGASEVYFGPGIAVNGFTVLSSDNITASIKITAGAATGAREVTVTTPGGSFALSKSFSVRQALPEITSVSPDQERQGAALNITITGTNLSGASEVRLGKGIAVDSITVISSRQITADVTIVPGAKIGARDVSVTTPAGSDTLPNGFRVIQSLPTITSISPDQERQGATLNVTITGTNLAETSKVGLGAGIAVNSFTILSSSQVAVNITLADGAATGATDVTVTTSGGSFTLPGSFMIKQALPAITSVSPNQGNQETTFTLTLNGSDLGGASEVRLGAGIVVNSITVLSSNQAAVNIGISTGAAIGARDVSITTPGGSFTLPNSFIVKQALPVISSLSPDHGSQGATLDVVFTGMNFTGASEIRLGTGIAVNSFTILSPAQITANVTLVAGAALGAADVSVVTPGGSFTLPNGFSVSQGQPKISSVSPSQGSQGETLTVIISGSNLDGATSVALGAGVAVQSFTNLSPTQLSANIMIDEDAVTGIRDVSVTTPGGSSTLSNSFNIKERSLGTLILALIWVGIAVVVVLFILILNMVRKKRAAKI